MKCSNLLGVCSRADQAEKEIRRLQDELQGKTTEIGSLNNALLTARDNARMYRESVQDQSNMEKKRSVDLPSRSPICMRACKCAFALVFEFCVLARVRMECFFLLVSSGP